VLGRVIDKVFDLLLAGLMFLGLFSEAKRYREWLAGQG
jgi:hypothetical protein